MSDGPRRRQPPGSPDRSASPLRVRRRERSGLGTLRSAPALLPRIAAMTFALNVATCDASPVGLCTASEATYLTALVSSEALAGDTPSPNAYEMTVSLCLDQDARPARLVMRLGQGGKIDAEIRGGPDRRFHTFTTEDGPHHGRDVIWVRRGDLEYCLSIAYAQGRGVGLDIFEKGQWRHRLFSGIEPGVRYAVSDDPELWKKVRSLLRASRSSSCV